MILALIFLLSLLAFSSQSPLSTISATANNSPAVDFSNTLKAVPEQDIFYLADNSLTIHPGTSEIYANNRLYLFGGVTLNAKDEFFFTNSLRMVQLTEANNGSISTETTHFWNDTYSGTAPHARAYSKIFLSEDARYIYIKGGTNKIQSFKNSPDIQFWTDSFDLIFPPYCVFKDMWRFDTKFKTWNKILHMRETALPENQRRLLCSAASWNTPLSKVTVLLVSLFVALLVGM